MQETKPKRRDTLFIATCVIYLVILVGFVILRTLSSFGLFNWMSEAAFFVTFSIITQVVLMVIVPVVGMMIYRKKFLHKQATQSFSDFMANPQCTDENKPGFKAVMGDWWFKKPGMKLLFWSVVLGFLCFFFNIFMSMTFNTILILFGHRGAAGGVIGGLPFVGVSGFLVALTLIAVLPGFCEEVTHRGMLLKGFAGRIGVLRAVMLSSLLFGLMHLNIVQFFYAAILGYLMALVVMATKNIWPAIIEHFMNNALGVYFMFANQYGWIGGNFNSVFGDFLARFFILIPLLIVGLYFSIIGIIHKLAREKFIEDNAKLEEPRPLHPHRGMRAINYYITADENKNRPPLDPLERTLIYGIVFLGVGVTAMTLVWGFL